MPARTGQAGPVGPSTFDKRAFTTSFDGELQKLSASTDNPTVKMGAMMGGSAYTSVNPAGTRKSSCYIQRLALFWDSSMVGGRAIVVMKRDGKLIPPLGTVNIFRYGAGANGIMRTLGQYMAMSGATFG
jgi:hypothetical protein